MKNLIAFACAVVFSASSAQDFTRLDKVTTKSTPSFHDSLYSQLDKVTASDRAVNDEFANAAAVDGNFAIIGAKLEDENASGGATADDAGSAYIYRRINDSWSQEAKLVAADRTAQDQFGRDVDISGTYCIIGSQFHSDFGDPPGAGAAYIFERSDGGVWSQAAKLEAPVQKANDYFGFSVAISGDYAVVGAYFEDEDENEANEILSAGSAYVFKRNNDTGGWSFYQKIVASDRSLDDRFGMSVDISGDQIIVGAEFDDVSGSDGDEFNAGSAYVFKLIEGEWEEEAQLTASDYTGGDRFGWTVGISGEKAIVGAYKNRTDELEMDDLFEAGAVYLFERGGGLWPQVKKVVASDRAGVDWYGYDVDISGDYAAVGAYRQNGGAEGDPPYSDAGAVYVLYDDPVDGWTELQKINHDDRGSSLLFPPSTDDRFGFGVGIDDRTLLAGAPFEDEDASGDAPLPNAGSAYFFTNPLECESPYPAVTGLTSEVAAAGVTLRWEPIIGSIGCRVQGGTSIGGPTQSLTQFNSDANEVFVSSGALSPGTTYLWRVRCGCTTSIVGPWSDIATFTTLGDGIVPLEGSNRGESWTIFPNPANGSVWIDLQINHDAPVVLRLVDLSGRLVREQRITAGRLIEFDLTGIPSGLYLMSKWTGDEVETVKLMVDHP